MMLSSILHAKMRIKINGLERAVKEELIDEV